MVKKEKKKKKKEEKVLGKYCNHNIILRGKEEKKIYT